MSNIEMDEPRPDWISIWVVLISVFAFSLLETMLTPVLPQIKTELNATPMQIGLLLVAILLVGAVSTPITGALADLFPKHYVMATVLTLLCVGILLAATAPNIEFLILGQALQGVGLGLFPLSVGLLSDLLPESRKQFGNGLFIAATMSSAAIGLVVPGMIVGALGFRVIFWPPLLALLVCLATILLRPPSRLTNRSGIASAAPHVDWAGAAILALSMVSLLMGLTQGPQHGWASARTLGLLGGGLAGTFFWIRFELRQRAPLIDLNLLKIPAVGLACCIVFTAGFAVVSAYVVVPLLLQTDPSSGVGFGADTSAIGLYPLPLGLSGMVVAPLVDRGGRAMGVRTLIFIGILSIALGVAAPIFLNKQGWHIVMSMVLLGVGFTIVLTTAMNVVVRCVDAAHVAGVSSMIFVIRNIGGMTGAQVSATILDSATGAGGVTTPSGYGYAFLVASLVALFGCVVSLFFPRLLPLPMASPPVDKERRLTRRAAS
jgi:MFS family permease